jgi:hypothetical protein
MIKPSTSQAASRFCLKFRRSLLSYTYVEKKVLLRFDIGLLPHHLYVPVKSTLFDR